MSTTSRIEVNKLRRRIVAYGSPTLAEISRVIEVLEAEIGEKAMRYRLEWGDAPKRSRVRVRSYHIESGMPFSPPDTSEE